MYIENFKLGKIIKIEVEKEYGNVTFMDVLEDFGYIHYGKIIELKGKDVDVFEKGEKKYIFKNGEHDNGWIHSFLIQEVEI